MQAKEWLCLNCQMKRALGVEEPPIPFMSSKTPTPSPSPVKQSSSTAGKKDSTQSQALQPSSSQQSKPSEGHKPPGQDSSATAKETTPHPQQKPTQQQKVKDATSSAKSEPPKQPEPSKEQSGFFGFTSGGARSRSPSPQPSVAAVSGKVLGFGSSLFSSASNLISSAVQDESSTVQPTSRKASSVSQVSDNSTPPTSRKGSEASKDSPKLPATPKQEHKKPEVTQPTKATADQTKVRPTSSQSPKASVKPLPRACPICKVSLKKEPPNYNTCTECKTTVCLQCGFNSLSHQPEVRKTFFYLKIQIFVKSTLFVQSAVMTLVRVRATQSNKGEAEGRCREMVSVCICIVQQNRKRHTQGLVESGIMSENTLNT